MSNDLSDFGWEPGDYWHRQCRTCKQEFDGGKYAWNCQKCAGQAKSKNLVTLTDSESCAFEINQSLYTGPLTVAAALGQINQPEDTGQHTVILLGLALDCSDHDRKGLIRVRMEMTPEDAEDAARGLLSMALAAKKKNR